MKLNRTIGIKFCLCLLVGLVSIGEVSVGQALVQIPSVCTQEIFPNLNPEKGLNDVPLERLTQPGWGLVAEEDVPVLRMSQRGARNFANFDANVLVIEFQIKFNSQMVAKSQSESFVAKLGFGQAGLALRLGRDSANFVQFFEHGGMHTVWGAKTLTNSSQWTKYRLIYTDSTRVRLCRNEKLLIDEIISPGPKYGEIGISLEDPKTIVSMNHLRWGEYSGLLNPAAGGLQGSPAIGERWAILVGISTYESGTDLRFAADDARLMKALLIEQAHFPESNVQLLINEQATKTGIKNALISVAAQAHSNDLVIFYYAGHGDAVEDDNGDEADGYDEALIPYDFTFKSKESLIRDDEFNIWLSQFLSSRLLVIFDSCFGGGFSRGVAPVDAISRALPHSAEGGEPQKIYSDGTLTESPGKTSALSPILMSASQESELAYELPSLGHGVFTYQLARALGGEGDLNLDGMITLQEAFQFIKEEMRKQKGFVDQTPLLTPKIIEQIPLVVDIIPSLKSYGDNLHPNPHVDPIECNSLKEEPFIDDFEDGNMFGWFRSQGPYSGLWTVEETGSSFILNGQGHPGHNYLGLSGITLRDFCLSLQIKPQAGTTSINIRFDKGSSYFVRMSLPGNELVLGKTISRPNSPPSSTDPFEGIGSRFEFVDLASSRKAFNTSQAQLWTGIEAGRWYKLELRALGNHLQVVLDGTLWIDYNDQHGPLVGILALELSDDAWTQFNQVQVITLSSSSTDSDGDRIPDAEDYCPDFPGSSLTNGC